jgi:hypothetical protein
MQNEKAEPNALSAMKKSVQKSPLKSTNTVNGIPEDLFKRIQEREKVIVQEKKKAEEDLKTNKHTYLKDTLLRMIDSLKSIYSVRRVNTLFMSKLLAELEDNQRGRFENGEEAKVNVKHLHMASPKWLKLISLPNGMLVKISPDYKKSNVKRDIEKYILELEAETNKAQQS